MRRLTVVILAAVLLPACRPREKVRLEPTQESLHLMSEVRMSDPQAAQQLIRGFHSLEQNSWRWTQSKFSVTLQPPKGSDVRGAVVFVDATVPDALVQKLGSVTLSSLLNGIQLGASTWQKPGPQSFTAAVPASTLGTEPVTVDFALDKFLPAGAVDARELGLIVSSVGMRLP